MTLVMFFSIYLPWVLTNDKKIKDKTRGMGLVLSGLFASLIVLGVSAAPDVEAITREQGLQGGVITLMYMFVSTSLGYQAVRAKKDPGAKAQSIYMAGLLVLLLMFDVLGARNAGDAPVYGPKTQTQQNLFNKEQESEAARYVPVAVKAGRASDRAKLTEAVAVAAARKNAAAEQQAKKALAAFNASPVLGGLNGTAQAETPPPPPAAEPLINSSKG